jgi:hypothetical protein
MAMKSDDHRHSKLYRRSYRAGIVFTAISESVAFQRLSRVWNPDAFPRSEKDIIVIIDNDWFVEWVSAREARKAELIAEQGLRRGENPNSSAQMEARLVT